MSKGTMRTRLRQRLSGVAGDSHGWTLIEMLVVVTLILILSSLALTQYRNSVRNAKEATLRSNLFIMREAIDQYYADKGKYPDSLDALVTENYLRNIPEDKDPATNEVHNWRTTAATPEPGTMTLTPGIYNVNSESSSVALDGTRYSEW